MQHTKPADKSDKTKQPNVITIEQNGVKKEIISFVPEITEQMALVDLNVLKRITSYLPKVDFFDIKHKVIDQLRATEKLEDFVDIMADEVAFHRSVNLITTYNPEQIKEKIGKVEHKQVATAAEEVAEEIPISEQNEPEQQQV